MPPLATGSHPRSTPTMTTMQQRAARVRFRRAVSLMVMTLVLPGSAQLVSGNRRVGLFSLACWMLGWLTVIVGAVVAVFWHELVFYTVSDATVLQLVRFVLMVGAVGWAALFMDAWRLGQPLTLGMGHRRAAVGVNGVLCFSVAGTLLFGAHLVGVQRDFMMTLFSNGKVSSAADGRYNILLLGGDSGAGRWGLRTDSMTVASIDADTGRTVLIGLPRNLTNFKFKKGSRMAKYWPHGWNCGYPNCELNAINTWVGDNLDKFKGVKDPGMVGTIQGIEGITGLKINYWAMVNLQGFKDLVDAVGGVTLNVRQPIPVGGLGADVTGYIQPGIRKLNGFDTLWFARSRDSSDDYSRMARQKCVMNAMLHQISPEVALTNFDKIAKASSSMISTDIPASQVDTFLQLALKARTQKVSTLSLVPPLIDTANPNLKLIRKKVAQAVAKGNGTAVAPKKVHHKVEAATGGSLGSMNGGYAANHSSNLNNVC